MTQQMTEAGLLRPRRSVDLMACEESEEVARLDEIDGMLSSWLAYLEGGRYFSYLIVRTGKGLAVLQH